MSLMFEKVKLNEGKMGKKKKKGKMTSSPSFFGWFTNSEGRSEF